jgi:hypothetical protein
MPTTYDGIPGNVTAGNQGNVSGATNTNPISITVSGSLPADAQTGCLVEITGVLGNNAANGQYPITVTGASTFTIPVAGNGAYTSGGTVNFLNLAGPISIPSDGDSDNEASIDNWAKTSCDRTQLLASMTGAYKLGQYSTLQLVLGDVGDPPTAWAVNSAGAGYQPMVSSPSLAPLVFQIPNMIIGDFAEVVVETTAWITETGGSPGEVGIAMAYAFGPYAAPPVPTSVVTVLGKRLKKTGSSINDYYPLSFSIRMRPLSFSDGSNSGIGFVYFYANAFGSGSVTIRLAGDYSIFARRYRPTGMTQ